MLRFKEPVVLCGATMARTPELERTCEEIIRKVTARRDDANICSHCGQKLPSEEEGKEESK